ncbi:DUF1877 family protein [Kitasatospora sp. NPDC057198]|uniref:DUF1877 family protein n=1 Tax=Kitasatospora sp. NPDC057198 TaxID=3346046 RepID=UPI0036261929
MGFHQHFRAVPPDELVVEAGWLAEFMLAAWRRFQEEYAAGVANAFEKDFDLHARLYTGGADLDENDSDVRTLPVYGGDPVFPESGEPPFLVMPPEQVARTAEYLAGADFDALWAVAGERIRLSSGDGDMAQEKAYRLGEHRDLTEFYGRAAAAGHAVVKAFRF